jgi:hypothetical protein
MKSDPVKHTKDEEFLINVAESIGSTLGSIVAQANAAPKSLMESDFVHSVESDGKNLLRKARAVARSGKKKATQKLEEMKSSKVAKSVRRGLRSGKSATKGKVRRTASKTKAGRRSANKNARRGGKRRA